MFINVSAGHVLSNDLKGESKLSIPRYIPY